MYSDRSQIDLSDGTIRIKKFRLSRKLWWKNCWKLTKLLPCGNDHSLLWCNNSFSEGSKNYLRELDQTLFFCSTHCFSIIINHIFVIFFHIIVVVLYTVVFKKNWYIYDLLQNGIKVIKLSVSLKLRLKCIVLKKNKINVSLLFSVKPS